MTAVVIVVAAVVVFVVAENKQPSTAIRIHRLYACICSNCHDVFSSGSQMRAHLCSPDSRQHRRSGHKRRSSCCSPVSRCIGSLSQVECLRAHSSKSLPSTARSAAQLRFMDRTSGARYDSGIRIAVRRRRTMYCRSVQHCTRHHSKTNASLSVSNNSMLCACLCIQSRTSTLKHIPAKRN